MADIKISDLGAAAALDGSELVEIVQGGSNVQTTAGDIAALSVGAVQKLAEVVVSSAQTDIDFTGLDLDADGIYRLEVFVVPDTGGVHNISLFYNGDTTVGNYARQQIYGFSGSAGGSQASDALIFFTNVLGGTTNPFGFGATFRKAAGAKPLANSSGTTVHNDGTLIWAAHSVRWTNTANVTSIKLRNSITNGFGVGTFARLYKIA